jgi:hypothetical protein
VPIDLTLARQRAASQVLTARALIERNPDAERDELFDPVSMNYVTNDDGWEVIATNVPCSFRDSSLVERVDDGASSSIGTGGTGGVAVVDKVWIVSLDWDSPEVKFGDRVTITTDQDPLVDGIPMFVRRPVTGQHRVFRRVECARRQRGEDRG